MGAAAATNLFPTCLLGEEAAGLVLVAAFGEDVAGTEAGTGAATAGDVGSATGAGDTTAGLIGALERSTAVDAVGIESVM